MEKFADKTEKDASESGNKQNAREHLANERTLLAWIRTSIGIMAFGFVVVKFSLFVKQISLLLGKNSTIPQHGYFFPDRNIFGRHRDHYFSLIISKV